MDFTEYQRQAKKSAVYPKHYKVFYPALALSGEVGELNNKIKKVIRDNVKLNKKDASKELGDILWYVSALASDMELKLEDIAAENIAKLKDRKKRNKISGSGDYR
ncbi:nucleoside triphosphate pyrophosphohydrolase family protein [Candidatus Marsarchaeota archaeon]|nr:nucleoside triphosphate pyrophosphohydrolase family protein [Candidatus Marsarchaeota archaeon]